MRRQERGQATRKEATAMQIQEPTRAAATHDGTAIDAIATWLEGHYQAGEEPALLRVIRRDTCSELSDAEIKDVVYTGFDRGQDAAAVLSSLLDADRRDIGRSTAS
jgi:hypothetical protein